MFRYEIQFLARARGDFERQVAAVSAAPVAGRLGFKSYFFAGLKGLVVLAESEADKRAVQRAVPEFEQAGSWEIPVLPERAQRPHRLAA